MSLADVFNTLGQTVIPTVTAAVFPDLCNITSQTQTSDSAGGFVNVTTDEYVNVPVAYEPKESRQRKATVGDKLVSVQEYLLTMATHDSAGDRINLSPATMRIKVLERGNEPEKTFRILSLKDNSGVSFELTCIRED